MQDINHKNTSPKGDGASLLTLAFMRIITRAHLANLGSMVLTWSEPLQLQIRRKVCCCLEI